MVHTESKRKKYVIVGISVALIVIIAIAVAVILIPPKAKQTGGNVEHISDDDPNVNYRFEDYSEPPTVLTEEESFIEKFLAEANTYSQSVETTTVPGQKVFFHVVTDGTVSDDNSLEGLEGPAKTIGNVVLAAGFRFDKEQKIFYSESQSWQRNWGFMPLYDVGAAAFGMYYDTMRLKFTHGEYDWMFQIWKGRYGITTGGEMGVYYKPKGLDSQAYACALDEDKVTMSFALYRGDELYMTRGPEPHWWLTGFKLLDMVDPKELTMHATFFMDDAQMADALEAAITDLGFIKNINYQRLGLTMTIIWR